METYGYNKGNTTSEDFEIIVENVNNSTILTDVINFGRDYAMGDFIGETLDQFEEITNFESYEISLFQRNSIFILMILILL